MDGMLSQEEINALLNGVSDISDSNTETPVDGETQEYLTEEEKDALGEVSNISMGSAATTLSTLVNSKVVITTPTVSYSNMEKLSRDYDKPCVFIQISYKEGLDGSDVLIMKETDVKVITDLMMGGDGTNIENELTELHLSAISEAMNQMMGAAATSLSSLLEKKVDISPPTASLIDLNDTITSETMFSFLDEEFVVVKFKMEIEGLVDSQLMQLYPFSFARDIYKKFVIEGSEDDPVQPQEVVAAAEMSSQPPRMQEQPRQMGEQMQNMGMPQNMSMQMGGNGAMNQSAVPTQNVNVQPAQFQNFSNSVSPMMQQENIDLIMDVPLEVTVELGRTSKSIKEILDFSPGTIIELNKLAGEPIDVLVNGKFVAKGEVVVIEENFGIRVTEIVK